MDTNRNETSFVEALINKAKEEPLAAMLAIGTLATGLSKLVDAQASAKSKRAYAKYYGRPSHRNK